MKKFIKSTLCYFQLYVIYDHSMIHMIYYQMYVCYIFMTRTRISAIYHDVYLFREILPDETC